MFRLGASLFVQVLDPQAFSGTAELHRQMDWLADKCKNNPPADATPGVFAQACNAETQKLYDAIWTNLKK